VTSALILFKISVLYKSFTYLLTYTKPYYICVHIVDIHNIKPSDYQTFGLLNLRIIEPLDYRAAPIISACWASCCYLSYRNFYHRKLMHFCRKMKRTLRPVVGS